MSFRFKTKLVIDLHIKFIDNLYRIQNAVKFDISYIITPSCSLSDNLLELHVPKINFLKKFLKIVKELDF